MVKAQHGDEHGSAAILLATPRRGRLRRAASNKPHSRGNLVFLTKGGARVHLWLALRADVESPRTMTSTAAFRRLTASGRRGFPPRSARIGLPTDDRRRRGERTLRHCLRMPGGACAHCASCVILPVTALAGFAAFSVIAGGDRNSTFDAARAAAADINSLSLERGRLYQRFSGERRRHRTLLADRWLVITLSFPCRSAVVRTARLSCVFIMNLINDPSPTE